MPRAVLTLARQAVGQEVEDAGTSTALAPSRRAPALLRALTPTVTGSPAASRRNTAQRRQESGRGRRREGRQDRQVSTGVSRELGYPG